MIVRLALLLGLGLTVAACSGGAKGEVAEETETLDEIGDFVQGDDAWIDSEPEGAQELAESVVDEPFNEDKKSQLTMRISRLVDRTTGLRGFAARIGSEDTSLEDRLARLGAEETELEVRIRLPGSILFDFNSDEIRADAERTLTELAEVLKAYGTRPVRVEGHTDAIASDEYNRELSERRAGAVRDWLEVYDVAADRLTTVGHGESQPVAPNNTVAGRQLNRRVEVVVEKGETE
ncbi:OmpA family protein [bacterium AH-315-O15]|nr:OmpA family protein [bacterium AH-315-O15]